MPKTKSAAHINPYCTADHATQVRAALQAAGPGERYASLSDLVVAATMDEVKTSHSPFNRRKAPWPMASPTALITSTLAMTFCRGRDKTFLGASKSWFFRGVPGEKLVG
ncbi:hypothetical protein J7I84_20890 [Arthrobacter sp. ISL-85]|uniref:ParB family protein n=1 Tax=Arthrobacter sp. ISL-85 TaxID=2819115 RepID=UPI001BE8A0FF|nr:hypothetical protein [Arthrobacter sp. ISL-85]MBT2568899.1 hypothetical protein [Arthrobacter sp. ISL-85]